MSYLYDRPKSTDGGGVGRKQQAHSEIQLHGQGLGSTATFTVMDESRLTGAGAATSSSGNNNNNTLTGPGNILTAARGAAAKPHTNSSRTLPSQAKVLKKLTESQRNSMFVGTNAGVQPSAAAAPVAPIRKVMNYADHLKANKTSGDA